MQSDRITRARIEITILAVAAIVVGVLLRTVVFAGSLTPSAAPAGTMRSLAEIYTPIAGTYDASGVTPSMTGSAIQIARCAARKVQGATCP